MQIVTLRKWVVGNPNFGIEVPSIAVLKFFVAVGQLSATQRKQSSGSVPYRAKALYNHATAYTRAKLIIVASTMPATVPTTVGS